ncbi:P-loop containing nucleoside triphosphate hydrolase protein [Myxozyma melibiosi]|uniref:RNA helicase n=1 Tax=Myxozyma melibiosi TaxID=54550 RepID=A0ABR1F0U9_9ASCO
MISRAARRAVGTIRPARCIANISLRQCRGSICLVERVRAVDRSRSDPRKLYSTSTTNTPDVESGSVSEDSAPLASELLEAEGASEVDDESAPVFTEAEEGAQEEDKQRDENNTTEEKQARPERPEAKTTNEYFKDHPRKRFEDFNLREAVLRSLKLKYPEVTHPTTVQQELLDALLQNCSFVGVSPAGTGKSFAAVLHLLSQPRYKTPIPSVSSLILVHSIELAHQYMDIIVSSLRQGNAPVPIPQVVQVLCRAGDHAAQQQVDLLRQYPVPHILIATPGRMLEILSNDQQRELLHLAFVRTVVIDEVDKQTKLDIKRKTSGKTLRKMEPLRMINQLMTYLTKLRQKALRVYSLDLPLINVALSSSRAIGQDVVKKLAKTEWMDGAPLKVYSVPNSQPSKRDSGQDTEKNLPIKITYKKVVEKGHINSILSAGARWKPAKKYHDVVTDTITERHLKALISEFDAGQIKKTLLIVPDTVSKRKLIAALMEKGKTVIAIDSLTMKESRPFADGGFEDLDLAATQSIFLEKNNESPEFPDFLISGAKQISGINFPGLRQIYVLGAMAAIQASSLDDLKFLCRPLSAHEIEEAIRNPREEGAPHEEAKVTCIL